MQNLLCSGFSLFLLLHHQFTFLLPLSSPHFTSTVCYCSVHLSFLWEEYSHVSTHLHMSGTSFPFWRIILKQLKCWFLQKDLSDNSLVLILVKCSSCALWAVCFWLIYNPLSLKVVFIHVLGTWYVVVVVGGLVAVLCLTPATLWAVACQAPLPMGFSGQEY